MELVFLNLLGVESIGFCCGIMCVLRTSKKLANYLNTYYPEFIDKNLSAPYWAGDWSVANQHIRAIRNAYFGPMPDDESRRLQGRMRMYGVLSMSLFVMFIVTLLTSALILIRQTSK